MTKPRVVGLDLSLTSTGVCVAVAGGPVTVDRLKPPKGARGVERLRYLREVVGYAAGGCDLAVVEGPSFGSRSSSMDQIHALHWFVRDELDHLGVPAAVMSPAGRAMYATGKGNAGKDEVLVSVVRDYPAVPVTGNDMADALALAAAGLEHLGHPLRRLPKTHTRALAKVQWPTPKETP